MREKIFAIKKEMEKQGVSHNRIAGMIGEDQTKISRILSGKTKKPDFEVVEKLCGALGMVADAAPVYASDKPETKKPTTPVVQGIIGIVEAMTPEQQIQAFKALSELFTASHQTEKP